MKAINIILFIAWCAAPTGLALAEADEVPAGSASIPAAASPAAPAAPTGQASQTADAVAAATAETPVKLPASDPFFTAAGAINEVMSQSTSPHAYDWREAAFELEIGADYADEANNYDTNGWHIGASVPTGGGFVFRLLIRRMYVHASHAGELIGRTPFRQAAQPTRYEYALGGGWALLEGRSMSRLSPLISDLEHVMLATFGLHYTDPNSGTIPKMGDDTGLLPGQSKEYSNWNLELGLRWNIYLPRGAGIFFEMQKNWPRTVSENGVASWQTFTAGGLWSFGDK